MKAIKCLNRPDAKVDASAANRSVMALAARQTIKPLARAAGLLPPRP